MCSSTCARSNVRHCRSWYEARTTRLVKAPPTCPSLCCNISAARNSSQKECDAATPLAPLVPTSLASLVLAPSVIIGACGAKHTWARPKVGCDALVTADLIHNNAYILAEKAHVGQRTASTAIRPFGPRVAASSRWQPDPGLRVAAMEIRPNHNPLNNPFHTPGSSNSWRAWSTDWSELKPLIRGCLSALGIRCHTLLVHGAPASKSNSKAQLLATRLTRFALEEWRANRITNCTVHTRLCTTNEKRPR